MTGVAVLWGNCSVKEGKGIIVIVLITGEVGNTGLDVGDELEVGAPGVAEICGVTVAETPGVSVSVSVLPTVPETVIEAVVLICRVTVVVNEGVDVAVPDGVSLCVASCRIPDRGNTEGGRNKAALIR